MKKEKEHAIEFAKYVVNDHLFNFHLKLNEDFLDLWYRCFLDTLAGKGENERKA